MNILVTSEGFASLDVRELFIPSETQSLGLAAKLNRGGDFMPAALISLMDEKERKQVAKQMDDIIKLMRENNAQVTKLVALMQTFLKAMSANAGK